MSLLKRNNAAGKPSADVGVDVTVAHVSQAASISETGTLTTAAPEANDFIVVYTSTSGGILRTGTSLTLDGVSGVRIGSEQAIDGGGQAVTLNSWGFVRSAMPNAGGTYNYVYTASGGINDIAVILCQYRDVDQATPTELTLGSLGTNVSTPATLSTPRAAGISRFVSTAGSIAHNESSPSTGDVAIEAGYTTRAHDIANNRSSMAVADIQTADAANSVWTYSRDPVLDSIATQSFVINAAT